MRVSHLTSAAVTVCLLAPTYSHAQEHRRWPGGRDTCTCEAPDRRCGCREWYVDLSGSAGVWGLVTGESRDAVRSKAAREVAFWRWWDRYSGDQHVAAHCATISEPYCSGCAPRPRTEVADDGGREEVGRAAKDAITAWARELAGIIAVLANDTEHDTALRRVGNTLRNYVDSLRSAQQRIVRLRDELSRFSAGTGQLAQLRTAMAEAEHATAEFRSRNTALMSSLGHVSQVVSQTWDIRPFCSCTNPDHRGSMQGHPYASWVPTTSEWFSLSSEVELRTTHDFAANPFTSNDWYMEVRLPEGAPEVRLTIRFPGNPGTVESLVLRGGETKTTVQLPPSQMHNLIIEREIPADPAARASQEQSLRVRSEGREQARREAARAALAAERANMQGAIDWIRQTGIPTIEGEIRTAFDTIGFWREKAREAEDDDDRRVARANINAQMGYVERRQVDLDEMRRRLADQEARVVAIDQELQGRR
jgi:hypothetical protein